MDEWVYGWMDGGGMNGDSKFDFFPRLEGLDPPALAETPAGPPPPPIAPEKEVVVVRVSDHRHVQNYLTNVCITYQLNRRADDEMKKRRNAEARPVWPWGDTTE